MIGFGYDVIKRAWELMPTNSAMNSISKSLQEKSTSFLYELNNFGIWTFFTNSRAIDGKYFEEAENYPTIKFRFSDSLLVHKKLIHLIHIRQQIIF